MLVTAKSSHGTFVFDAIAGGVITCNLTDDFGSRPIKVDVYEYFDYYGESLPSSVDVMDIGFTTLNGDIIEPDHQWREDIKYNVLQSCPLVYNGHILTTTEQTR